MITSVTLGAITLICGEVSKPQPVDIAKISIPGRDGNILQSTGKGTKVIELQGILKGAAKDTDKAILEGYLNTIQTYNDGVDNITVFIEEVFIPTIGGQPNHYIFNIRLNEYIQS